MSHNEQGAKSPPPPEKETTKKEQTPFLSSSFEGFGVNPHSHKEEEELIVKLSPTATSTEDKVKKLKTVNKKIYLMQEVRMILILIICDISATFMFFLWMDAKIYGIPLSSIVLLSHSLSFLGLVIVHYKVIPPLIDEWSIVSNEIKERRNYPPAYHPPIQELFWRYQRVVLAIATDIGIWKYLSYENFQNDVKTVDETHKGLFFCFGLELLMIIVSRRVVYHLGPVYGKPKKKKQEKEGKVDKIVDLQTHDSLRSEDEVKTEGIKEITELRNEILEKEVSYSKLLQENNDMLMTLLHKVKKLRKKQYQSR